MSISIAIFFVKSQILVLMVVVFMVGYAYQLIILMDLYVIVLVLFMKEKLVTKD